MTFLGILIGIVVLAAAYAVTMCGYFALRRKMPGAKFFVEIVIMGVAVVFSFCVKLTVYMLQEGDNIEDGAAALFFAVYKAVAGLALDGIDSVSQLGGLVNCLYSGVSLYAVLVFFSVISAKASYETYSYFALRLLGSTMKDGTDIYIFMTATEDALTLADDIAAREIYAKDDDEKLDLRSRVARVPLRIKAMFGGKKLASGEKKRRCIIVFSGDGIGVFDRKDPLHREIMARGYYYWNFDKVKYGSEKSLLKRLHLYKDNAGCGRSRERDVEYNFFALALTADLKGSEATNADRVYDEVAAMTDEAASGKAPFVKASFYFMAASEINYEVYKRKMAQLVQEHLVRGDVDPNRLDGALAAEYYCELDREAAKTRDSVKIERTKRELFCKKCAKVIQKYCALYAFSEAKLAVKTLIEGRTKLFEKAIASAKANGKDALAADRLPLADFVGNGGKYRAMVLGFGKTGQLALNAVFMDTAYLDEEGNQPLFKADIYDMVADDGLFSSEHPMYLCASAGGSCSPMSDQEFADKTKHQSEKVKEAFMPIVQERQDRLKKLKAEKQPVGALKEYKIDDVVGKMRLPQLVFHKVSCFDPGFFDELDGESGQDDIKAAGKKKRKQEYNAYIVALGDDESNVAMANALLDDFKHENRSFKDGNVIVYVNVRDSRNRCRISWDDKDISRSEGHINVVLFGDASDMYTYRNIVDIDDDKKFNYAYQLLGGYTDDKDVNEKFKTDIAPIFKQGAQCSESFAEKVNEVIELLKIKVDDEQNEHYQKERDTKWMECSMMDRESNYGAKRFGYFFAHMLEEPDSVNEALIKRLSEIEHIRWSRFHMAYGWIYSGEKDKSIKEHNYLCPFEMLPLSEEEEIGRAVIVGGIIKTPSKEEKIDIRANDAVNVLLAALLYGKRGKEDDR